MSMMFKWLALRDSNPRLADYEPAVLTAELRAGKRDESMEFRVSSIGGDFVAGNKGRGGRPARPRMTGPVIPTL